MKTKQRIFITVSLLLCVFLFASTVYAGSINGPESGLLSQASGTFTYEGKTYVATPAALAQLRARLSDDDVDLTQEQADRAASMMYSNVEGGILDGYLTPVRGGGRSGLQGAGESILDRRPGSGKADRAAEKTKTEKAGKATVKVAASNSTMKVMKADGREILSASLPVKDTGIHMNGTAIILGIFLFLTIVGIYLAFRFKLFAHRNES